MQPNVIGGRLCLRQHGVESYAAGEEKYEWNGKRRRRHVLALAIILPVILLVVIPGFLLILGLGRVAGREMPRPGDATPIHGPSHEREIAGQVQLSHTREIIRRQRAGANCN